MPVRVGSTLHGTCGGYFRDNWGPKRVDAIGADWVVARTEDGYVVFAYATPEALEPYTKPGDLQYCCAECGEVWDRREG